MINGRLQHFIGKCNFLGTTKAEESGESIFLRILLEADVLNLAQKLLLYRKSFSNQLSSL